MPLSAQLLAILACPLCKGRLHYDPTHQELVCFFDRLAFPIIEEIPVLLEHRARVVSLDEIEELKG